MDDALAEAQTSIAFAFTGCSLGLCKEAVRHIGLLEYVRLFFLAPSHTQLFHTFGSLVIAGYEPQPPLEPIRLAGNPARRSSRLDVRSKVGLAL